MYAEQDLCRTDQTQGTCARSCRSYVSHPATRSIGYADDVDQGSVCPERHRSWIGLGSVRFMFPFRVYYNRHPGIAFGAPFSSSHTSTFQLLDKPWTQVSSLLPPRFLPSTFIAHRLQHSHCSSIFHRVLLTHALALFTSQFVLTKESPRIYTSMHSGGFEVTNLTYTRPEDNLIRHRGDRVYLYSVVCHFYNN